MATMKDVAARAKVSVSTVSIILNGKSQQRKIPQATQQRVWAAVRALGYQPNVSARKLRGGGEDVPGVTIALYWASDFRAPMLARFLEGVRQQLAACGRTMEWVIYPYENGRLSQDQALKSFRRFHAAVVANASQEDLRYLEENPPPGPVVLYNRKSARFPSAYVDDEQIGQLAAAHLAACGYRTAGVLGAPAAFQGMALREEAFIAACRQAGIAVEQRWLVRAGHAIADGVKAAQAFAGQEGPQAVFCASDALALGALHAFRQAGVAVPRQRALIAVGNGEEGYAATSAPPLTVVQVPIEEMGRACVALCCRLLDREEDVGGVALEARLIPRESTAQVPATAR